MLERIRPPRDGSRDSAPALPDARQAATLRISVLVPTYRRPKDLHRCLDALAAQSRRPDQLVVVVRDVDTESHEVVESFRLRAKDLNVHVATVSRPGILPAMNTGLAAMSGDVLCFTDDDAEPLPDWLARIERWYEDPSIVGVGGRDLNVLAPQTLTQSCRVVGRWTWYGRVEGNHHLALEPARPVDVFVLKGVNMSYRASVFEGFRLDERLATFAASEYEFDAGFFARRNGGRLVYDPQLLVRHYTSPRAEWGREDLVRFYDHSHNLTYVMLKHLPPGRRLIFLLYMFLVGQRASWGLVTLLYQAVVRRRLVPWAEIQQSMSGKIDAIRTYLAWRRGQRARPLRGAGGQSSIG